MKISIIPEDNVVIINGNAQKLVGAIWPENVRAIQWSGNSGFIEYRERGQEFIDDIAMVQPFIDLHAAAKALAEAPVVLTLEQLKAAKNQAINAWRLAANFTTFPHAGKVFSCDQLSRSDIDGTNGAMTLTNNLPPNWPGGWKAVDNTYIPITNRAEWEEFYLAMCAYGAVNFAHSQALKAALAAATTAEEVAAIVW
ncbi:DUF4376 domain-containing protein [Polaromonas sp.]|uniref:DUF4376 domain-containing protein n=1 Tax=Polaromonas sp. TaxID=1869339 RepID=UPI002730C624|nr:DUF4376 domain-containing protein [Polaromonas sp.]MDP1886635.1 DUF4376 domain-containing protein [Polaromonas sp.]